MKSNSVLRFGGLCGILVGLFNLLASAAYLLLPAAQKLGSPGAVLLPSVAESATMLIVLHLGFTLIGLFGLGLAPALSEWVRTPDNAGWLGWATNLALVGYAVFAVAGLLTIDHVPRVAAAYVAATDAATKAALLPVWRGSLDPFGFWGYGAVGIWILLVSLAGLGSARPGVSRALAVVGVLVGLLHLLVPVGFVLKATFLFALVNILGAIGATIWYIWAGLALRAAARQPGAARAA